MTLFQGIPVCIKGTGIALPERILTNDDMSRMVETSDQWIRERTGIAERRIASPDEHTSTFAERAARSALHDADMAPGDIDMIIVATNSPDMLFPGVAPTIQGALGATRAGAFDLQSGCTGGVYALAVGVGGIACGLWENVLVVGSETISRIVDWTDRNTCVLFGDGAGAVVLSRSQKGDGRFLSAELRSDGTKSDYLTLPAGLTLHPASHETVDRRMHYVTMKGNEVFKFVNRVIPVFLEEYCGSSGLVLDDIDWWFFHQANRRIIERAAARLKIPMEKVVINIEHYGNTSAASLFIALNEFLEEKRLQKKQKVLFTAFGAGMTYGGIIYEA